MNQGRVGCISLCHLGSEIFVVVNNEQSTVMPRSLVVRMVNVQAFREPVGQVTKIIFT